VRPDYGATMAQSNVQKAAEPHRAAALVPPYQRRGYAPRAVGAFVPQLTRKAFEKHGFATAALITDWGTIVGREVAGWCQPERLKWPRDVATYGEVADEDRGRPGATLVVAVDPARALDIEYRASGLVERINAFVGYRAVAKLHVVQSPAVASARAPQARPPAPRPAPAAPRALDLSAIADESLRAALAKLGAAMAVKAAATP
jgi:hypothetical protein